MSLINQMLQDLDARRATPGDGRALPSAVRPLPARPESRLPLILGMVVVLVAMGGGALYYLENRSAPVAVPAPAPLTAAPVAPPVESVPPGGVANPGPDAVSQPGAPAVVQARASGSSASNGSIGSIGSVGPSGPSGLPAAPVAALVASAPASASADNVAAEPLPSLGDSLRISESIDAPVEAKRKPAPRPAVKSSALSGKADEASEAVPLPDKKARASDSSGELRRGSTAAAASAPAPAARAERAPATTPRSGSIERSEAVASGREHAEAAYRKGIAAVNQGRVGEGLDLLRSALQSDSLHVAARQLMVRLLLEARQVEEAMRLLEAGLVDLPAQIGWAMSLARLQLERGDLNAAWRTLHHSEPAAMGNADYQGFAGHVLQRLGRYREAADHYQHALRIAPADGRWWLGLGYAFESEGRVDEARAAWLNARRSGNLSPQLMSLLEQKLK